MLCISSVIALTNSLTAGDEKWVKYNIGDSAEHIEHDGNLHGTFGADKVCEYIGKDHHGRAERQNLKVLRGLVPRGGIGAEKVQEGVREKERGAAEQDAGSKA